MDNVGFNLLPPSRNGCTTSSFRRRPSFGFLSTKTWMQSRLNIRPLENFRPRPEPTTFLDPRYQPFACNPAAGWSSGPGGESRGRRARTTLNACASNVAAFTRSREEVLLERPPRRAECRLGFVLPFFLALICKP